MQVLLDKLLLSPVCTLSGFKGTGSNIDHVGKKDGMKQGELAGALKELGFTSEQVS
jgi:hypothetical protein